MCFTHRGELGVCAPAAVGADRPVSMVTIPAASTKVSTRRIPSPFRWGSRRAQGHVFLAQSSNRREPGFLAAGRLFRQPRPRPKTPNVSTTRKTVTILFCDVTGSTALGEELDPESLPRGHPPLFHRDARGDRTPRRDGREVHRGRRDGGVRRSPDP